MDTITSRNTTWTRAIGVAALLTGIVAVVLAAFAWPAARTSVHDIPVAVAGPAPAQHQVAAALDARLPGGFALTPVADTAAAETAIRDRQVYAAIDLTGPTPQVIVATGASPAVAQAMTTLAAGLAPSAAASPVPVRDLAPLTGDDTRGAGLVAGVLPLVLGGMLGALLITQLISGTGWRLVTALLYAGSAGLVMAALLQNWLGSLQGNYWANAGALTLALAAATTVILGLESLLGLAGFAVGALLMMVLGNPLSGVSSAPEMLPGWSGTLGQYLPPGAAGSLLRSTSFFDGHAAAHPIAVLTAWLAIGLLLLAVKAIRDRRRSPEPAAQVESTAVSRSTAPAVA